MLVLGWSPDKYHLRRYNRVLIAELELERVGFSCVDGALRADEFNLPKHHVFLDYIELEHTLEIIHDVLHFLL